MADPAVEQYNYNIATKNAKFFAWVQKLIVDVQAKGHDISVEYIPGLANQYYTLPDSAWLLVDGYFMFFCMFHMTSRADPVAMVETFISNQKAFGRVLRNPPEEL